VNLFAADSMPEQIDLISRGYADGLVGQLPSDMGSKSITTLLALSQDKEVDQIASTDQVLILLQQKDPISFVQSNSSPGSMPFTARIVLSGLTTLLALANLV